MINSSKASVTTTSAVARRPLISNSMTAAPSNGIALPLTANRRRDVSVSGTFGISRRPMIDRSQPVSKIDNVETPRIDTST